MPIVAGFEHRRHRHVGAVGLEDKGQVVVGISGFAGAGKSHLATKLRDQFRVRDGQVVRLDNIYMPLPRGTGLFDDYDWLKLREIVEAARASRKLDYQGIGWDGTSSTAPTAAPPSNASELPSPAVHITPPVRTLAPQLAAFSGIWQGRWKGPEGGSLPSQLIVERITAKSAQVVYIYGASSQFAAGWRRVQASVLPFGQIQFGGNGAPLLTFTMSQDDKSIAGTYQIGSYAPSTITMTKVG